MRLHQPRFRPCLETLESRDAPANLTTSFNALTRTLTVTGDGDNNQVQIFDGGGDNFFVGSPVDTINNVAGGYLSPAGVHNLTIRLLEGDDTVTFNSGVAVQKSVAIFGGGGANAVTATDLMIRSNFTIINGTNTTGKDKATFTNLVVGGTLSINNGNGDSEIALYRGSTGNSFVRGNVLVTNGSGWDRTDLVDTNVGGSVKVSNGLPDANGTAGNTLIYNFFNATTRSVIGGSVSVAYIAGNTVTWDGIFETHVLGNVTFNHGTGVFTTHLDAVKIGGKLTLTGTGANQINLGTWSGVGLIVGGPMTVLGGPAIDTVTLNKVAVGGATLIKLGDGPNTVTINDSDFGGIFTLITGAGEDTINLDTGVGTSTATTFVREVRMFLGDGVDTVNRAGNADANQRIVFYRTFVIRHGLGGDVFSSTAEKEIAPFGGFILWLV